ncbi:hypothetical protein ACYTFC_17175 [Streptomyces globosus]
MKTARAPLWLQLLRIGTAAGKAASVGRARSVALVCATLAISVALYALVLVIAAYEGRDLRDAARSPVRASDGPGEREAQLLYRPAFDVVDDLQFQVIYLFPLKDDAPLPPGVEAWPQPGQALLSPALLAAGRDEGIATRFGTLAGTIGEEGLASPGEKFAYVRPSSMPEETDRMWPTYGFGSPKPFGMGEGMFVKPRYLLLGIVFFMGALPAAALASAAARTGSDARDQRTALLGALGGGRRARAAVNVGEAGLAVVIGAAAGLALGLAALAGNTELPWVEYTLSVADARRWAGVMLGVPVVAALLVLLCVVLMHPPQGRRNQVRPRLARTRLPRWWPWLCPFLVFTAVQGPGLAPNPAVRLLVYVVGVGGTILTLPSVLGLAAAAAGRALAAAGRRTGSAGALVSGRWAAAWPGTITRLTAGVVIAFVLVGQTQLWVTRNTGPAVQAEQTVKRVGTSVVLVHVRDERPAPSAFLGSLPPGVQVLRLKVDRANGSAELNGPCEALQRLSLPCTEASTPVDVARADIRVRELHSWDTPGQGLLTREAAAPEGGLVVLVGRAGEEISVPAVKEAANRYLGMAVSVEAIAGSWLTAANMDQRQGLWVLLFGAFAVVVVSVSITVSNLGEFVRFSRQITALGVLSGNRAIYFSTSFFSLFVPLAAASLIGMLTHYWLATPMTVGSYSVGAAHSWPFLTLILAGMVAMAVVVWLWGAFGSLRLTRHWRPAND